MMSANNLVRILSVAYMGSNYATCVFIHPLVYDILQRISKLAPSKDSASYESHGSNNPIVDCDARAVELQGDTHDSTIHSVVSDPATRF
jgi:hypothetical protein